MVVKRYSACMEVRVICQARWRCRQLLVAAQRSTKYVYGRMGRQARKAVRYRRQGDGDRGTMRQSSTGCTSASPTNSGSPKRMSISTPLRSIEPSTVSSSNSSRPNEVWGRLGKRRVARDLRAFSCGLSG